MVDPPVLAVVEPSLIAGLDTRVEEDFGPGRVTFATLPQVPGAEAFTDEIQAVVDADVERFRNDTLPSDKPPIPELAVSWDLVGASTAALGARVLTTELNASGDDGRVAVAWYDVPGQRAVSSTTLLRSGAQVELADRLREAARRDPRIDAELLDREVSLGTPAFDALAFDTSGSLFVEFDQGHVAAEGLGPVALVVDAAGLLSPFGRAARKSALNPVDPQLAPQTPQPTTAPTGQPLTPPAATEVDCAVQRCVALTFDDGPVEGTSELLDVLAEKGVRATFFVVGSNAAAQPEILARMVREGHVIGNHTEDHPDLTKLDADSIRAEIDPVNDTVEAATGLRPVLLRPPYGATGDTVDQVAGELGMAEILWNVDPEDWKDKDSAIVTQRVLASTAEGGIVLSHDIHETTRQAYAGIIDGLRDEGFTLVTVPELLGDPEPGLRYYSR